MKPLTDLLHLLLCQQPHTYDMMKIVDRKSGVCYYYLEADIADGDSMPDHVEWFRITESFKASLNLKSDEEALKFVKETIELSQKIKALGNGCAQRLSFIKTVLD